MEPFVTKAYSEAVRTEIFNWLGVDADQVQDLNGFENYVYGYEDQVIRITHDSHRTEHQLLGEMEFVRWLAENGASVCRPQLLEDGSLVKTIGEFHICQFTRSFGESVRQGRYSGELIQRWGEGIGTMHRLAATFQPRHRRQGWREDENHQFHERINPAETVVLEQADQLTRELEDLAQPNTQYGLIHSDAHTGNFLVENGRPVFFDFDDCLYTWYGYDLATVLLGHVLLPESGESDQEKAASARAYLLEFLEGYSRVNTIDALMIEKMPLFLKLREFSLYAVIQAHRVLDDPQEEMPAAFMQGRRERLEAGIPFVDLDFGEFC